MKKPDEKSLFLLICFLCGWSIAGFLHFIHDPILEETEGINAEKEELLREIIDIENFSNQHRDMKQFSAEVSKQQEKVDRALPDELTESRVIHLLQQHALKHHIRILSISPEQQKEESGLTVLPLQLKLDCSYFQLLDFLRDIQEADRFVRISRLEVHNQEGRLLFNLEASVYAMPEK